MLFVHHAANQKFVWFIIDKTRGNENCLKSFQSFQSFQSFRIFSQKLEKGTSKRSRSGNFKTIKGMVRLFKSC